MPFITRDLSFTNQLMGAGVTFSVQLVNKFKGSDGTVTLDWMPSQFLMSWL